MKYTVVIPAYKSGFLDNCIQSVLAQTYSDFELAIGDQTTFLGWINGAEKDKAFKEASIFCLPSYGEGFPMSVLMLGRMDCPLLLHQLEVYRISLLMERMYCFLKQEILIN